MNIILWILQILLAAHTLIGAIWKLKNSEQAVPSLTMIPHSGWLLLSALEVVCVVALVTPLLLAGFAAWVPFAFGFIALEMLVFVVLHLSTGHKDKGPVIYWSVVALVCIALGLVRWMTL